MKYVMDLIRYRRSLRAYTPEPLKRAEVETLLEAGRYAPNGHGRQSWRFTAILNKDVLLALNTLIQAGFRDMEPGPCDPPELHDAKEKAQRQGETYCFTYHAPCLVIASDERDNPNGVASCACALENMFLTAYDLGLGACWVNQLHWQDANPALRAYLARLGLPATHTICGSGVFGHPGCAVPNAAPHKEHTFQIVE